MGIFMTTRKKEHPLGHVFPKTKVTFDKYVGEREGDCLIFCSHRPHPLNSEIQGCARLWGAFRLEVKEEAIFIDGAGFELQT